MKKVLYAEVEKNWLKNPDTVVSYSHTFKKDDANAELNDLNRKVIPCGTIIPANDGTAIGIAFDEVDVTDGDVAGSLLVHGDVVASKLPQTISAEAKTALEKAGIYFFSENAE
jgi:hypothetical protein